MSGLSRTPGKRVWVYPHRGFESRPLRHWLVKKAANCMQLAAFLMGVLMSINRLHRGRPRSRG